MRKLKLQMQVTVDGFVAGADGQLDWMTWNWDDTLKQFTSTFTDSCDTILLGRKMAEGFISYWEAVVNKQPDSDEFPFAKKMVDFPKIVFSKTPQSIKWKNVVVENRDLVTAVNQLKSQSGKDIIVYGGANFVAELIKNNLIDELCLFVNPTVIGNGLRIFSGPMDFGLIESTRYTCGIVVNQFKPSKRN